MSAQAEPEEEILVLHCNICGKLIPSARAKFLIGCGNPMTCLDCQRAHEEAIYLQDRINRGKVVRGMGLLRRRERRRVEIF